MALVLASNPNIQEETAGSLNSRPASSKRHSPRKARTTQKNPKQTNKQTNKPSLQQKQWAGFSPSETQSNKQIYKQAHLESNPKQAINTQTHLESMQSLLWSKAATIWNKSYFEVVRNCQQGWYGCPRKRFRRASYQLAGRRPTSSFLLFEIPAILWGHLPQSDNLVKIPFVHGFSLCLPPTPGLSHSRGPLCFVFKCPPFYEHPRRQLLCCLGKLCTPRVSSCPSLLTIIEG